ncbi:MAG: endo-1,4-beta-xylanase [Chloroflexota bacterium]
MLIHRSRWLIVLFMIIVFSGCSTDVTSTSTPFSETVIPMRELADPINFYVGTSVRYRPFVDEPMYTQMIAEHYNLIMPENMMKLDALYPDPDTFTPERADAILAFAEENDIAVRGGPIIWHNALPEWILDNNMDRDSMLIFMETYINTVVEHFQGRVYAWDVVNEAISPSGSGLRTDSIWMQTLGEEYIAIAFQLAHEADPDALLFYSEGGTHFERAKAESIYQLVRGLVEDGVPLDGISLHLHVDAHNGFDAEFLYDEMQRYADLGLLIEITEMDVRISRLSGSMEERLNIQAGIYQDALDVCLQITACTTFATWGFTDQHSWIDARFGEDDPLPFDSNYQPKPAYYALVQSLQTANQNQNR